MNDAVSTTADPRAEVVGSTKPPRIDTDGTHTSNHNRGVETKIPRPLIQQLTRMTSWKRTSSTASVSSAPTAQKMQDEKKEEDRDNINSKRKTTTASGNITHSATTTTVAATETTTVHHHPNPLGLDFSPMIGGFGDHDVSSVPVTTPNEAPHTSESSGWDPHRVYFNEFDGSSKNGSKRAECDSKTKKNRGASGSAKAVNMFQKLNQWSSSTKAFSSSSVSQVPKPLVPPIAKVRTSDVAGSLLDPAGWPLQPQFATESISATHPVLSRVRTDEMAAAADDDDDASLLQLLPPTMQQQEPDQHEAGDDSEDDLETRVLVGDAEEDTTRRTKEERMQLYQQTNGDASSSTEDDASEIITEQRHARDDNDNDNDNYSNHSSSSSSSTSGNDVNEEIGYISRDSEDSDEPPLHEDYSFIRFQSNGGSIAPSDAVAIPTFEPAAIAARQAESQRPPPPLPIQDLKTNTRSFPKISLPKIRLRNVPSRDPKQEQQQQQQLADKNKLNLIRKLAPPPTEKLRQWEEQKARPFQHLQQVRVAKAAAAAADHASGLVGNDHRSATKTATVESGSTVLPPFQSFHSAASSSNAVHTANWAEKIDHAISAAAMSFDEQQQQQRGPLSPHEAALRIPYNMPLASQQLQKHRQHQQRGQQVELSNTSKSSQYGSFGTRNIAEPVQRRRHGGSGPDPASRLYIVPTEAPSPFERVAEQCPRLLSLVLSFLGDPVAVSRLKMINKACHRYVDQNEHVLMRDAVRLGGMSMNVRPYFWLWVTLERSDDPLLHFSRERVKAHGDNVDRDQLLELERSGREGKWSSIIERDVSRSFGNLPPHKTGARLRTDSIVRALVTWGKNRIMKRGVKGSGDPPPPSRAQSSEDDTDDEGSTTPADTVSDWGGVTPVGSFTNSLDGGLDLSDEQLLNTSVKSEPKKVDQRPRKGRADEELALSGNSLTDEVKASLQEKLRFVLFALAAAHTDVGYCQGMDYVVAHLLRILQETILWKAANGTLHGVPKHAPFMIPPKPWNEKTLTDIYSSIESQRIVEETCFRVMDSFFVTYNLRHFYWPELRCLKTCCRVFERIIQIKLPVLADHFDHHELNVGLFALGWFQTLFLYLPSMPSATVCHMWDIWLVERSFKVFFRVGTAILFLSQPILLNHELEGMMLYLNTFPDATLLSPDILIACALQIKITNRMLMEVEEDISLFSGV